MCNTLIDSCLSELRQSPPPAANEALHLTPTLSAVQFLLRQLHCKNVWNDCMHSEKRINSGFHLNQKEKSKNSTSIQNLKWFIANTHTQANANMLSTKITNSADHLSQMRATCNNSSCTRAHTHTGRQVRWPLSIGR